MVELNWFIKPAQIRVAFIKKYYHFTQEMNITHLKYKSYDPMSSATTSNRLQLPFDKIHDWDNGETTQTHTHLL